MYKSPFSELRATYTVYTESYASGDDINDYYRRRCTCLSARQRKEHHTELWLERGHSLSEFSDWIGRWDNSKNSDQGSTLTNHHLKWKIHTIQAYVSRKAYEHSNTYVPITPNK